MHASPVLRLLVIVALCASAWWPCTGQADAQTTFRSLESALAAYSARDFRRAATLARVAGDRAQGAERETARYLEGLALYKAEDLDGAASALRTASTSSDRFIAGQSGVTLGSVEIERKRLDAAGHAYRRAAGSLDGADAKRAHSIAARCFDAAGLSGLAAGEREAAGEPPSVSPAPTRPSSNDAPRKESAPAFKPGPKQQPRTVTADDKPQPRIAPIFYAIQAGAYSSPERAAKAVATLRKQCDELGLSTRTVAKENADGTTLHVIQIGMFGNRGAASKALLKFPKSGFKVEVYLADADHSD